MECYGLSQETLSLIFFFLSNFYTVESRMRAEGNDSPISECLHIRLWGKPVGADQLKLRWYVPTSRHAEIISRLLEKFILPEIVTLQAVARKEITLDRERLEGKIGLVECSLRAGLLLEESLEAPLDFSENWSASMSSQPMVFTSHVPDPRTKIKPIP
ncbi:unnamed protein product, partial [Cyprideis torosa]